MPGRAQNESVCHCEEKDASISTWALRGGARSACSHLHGSGLQTQGVTGASQLVQMLAMFPEMMLMENCHIYTHFKDTTFRLTALTSQQYSDFSHRKTGLFSGNSSEVGGDAVPGAVSVQLSVAVACPLSPLHRTSCLLACGGSGWGSRGWAVLRHEEPRSPSPPTLPHEHSRAELRGKRGRGPSCRSHSLSGPQGKACLWHLDPGRRGL